MAVIRRNMIVRGSRPGEALPLADVRFDPPFEAFFLDFDGVILDSVSIKSAAFEDVIAQRWPRHAEDAHEYFMRHGGVPRRKKLEHVVMHIVETDCSDGLLDSLCNRLAELVFDRVLACSPKNGAMEFLKRCQDRARCFVLSGTPEAELRQIVDGRKMTWAFEGVFGSPRDKVEIGREILATHRLAPSRCAFVGDATTDRDAARDLGMPFFGIRGVHLTPFVDGSEILIDDLADLVERWTRLSE